MGLDYDFVKVLDFGLVKQEVASQSSGRCSRRRRRSEWEPRRTWRRRPFSATARLDRRVDIYALGCVAYFLLTGERVFDAPTQMKLLMQHVEAAPIPPSQRTEQPISREVDELVLCVSAEGSGAPADRRERSVSPARRSRHRTVGSPVSAQVVGIPPAAIRAAALDDIPGFDAGAPVLGRSK